MVVRRGDMRGLRSVAGVVLLFAQADAFVAPSGSVLFRTRAKGFSAAPTCRQVAARRGLSMHFLEGVDPFVANLVIGGIAGTVSNLAVFPIDLVKTKLQNGARGTEGGVMATLSNVVRVDGIGGLWAGSTPVLLGSAPESALQLAVDTWLVATAIAVSSEIWNEVELTLLVQIVCGGIAGASTLLVTNPMETLRIRASMEGQTSSFIDNVNALGVRGLYSGWEACLLRDIPFTASYFPLFCLFKTQALPFLTAHDAEGAACTVAALAAGMISAAVTAPLDVIKTRVQAQAGRARPMRSSSSAFIAAYSEEEVPADIAGTVRELVAREGWGGLLCGAGPRVMRLAPGMAITLALYEQLQML